MEAELKIRKILGRTYLNENRLREALEVFGKILADYPEDTETLLILGNFYLASGEGKTAKTLYLRAQAMEPDNRTIQRQIVMAEELTSGEAEDATPTDLSSTAHLLQRLTGRTKTIPESDILRAAQLLDTIIQSENPAELVAARLDEIDELLPALIELNIRQAQADGRPDLAEGLRNLQENVASQLETRENPPLRVERIGGATSRFTGNILLLLPDLEKKSERMALLKPALEALGCHVNEKREYLPARDQLPDVVITSNPHTNPALGESLSALSAANVPIIVDLDSDFEKQPVSHPDYHLKGLGTLGRSNAYSAALAHASVVSVAAETQAASLREVARQVCVLPDGWSQQNKLWEKSAAPHKAIHIGWVGTSGQLEDLLMIRRYILRILREFPETRIVIIGSPQAYRLFEGLPENQRMYLPLVSQAEFPYLLGQLDILLVPLRNLPYNLSQTDTPLMEAGVRGIPWLASSIPAFRRWATGGIIAEAPDDWHLNLRHLILDRDLRASLGRAGRTAARAREMGQVGYLWLEVIHQITQPQRIMLPLEVV